MKIKSKNAGRVHILISKKSHDILKKRASEEGRTIVQVINKMLGV